MGRTSDVQAKLFVFLFPFFTICITKCSALQALYFGNCFTLQKTHELFTRQNAALVSINCIQSSRFSDCGLKEQKISCKQNGLQKGDASARSTNIVASQTKKAQQREWLPKNSPLLPVLQNTVLPFSGNGGVLAAQETCFSFLPFI